MKRRILLTALLVLLTGCQQTPEQARKELAELGVEFTAPVFNASAENGDIVVVELFLTTGMNPDITDESGMTPLMRAAGKNNLSVARALLDSGAKVDPRQGNLTTPLDLAAEQGHTEMVELLLRAGAETIRASSLSSAKEKGYTEIAELLASIKLPPADYEASAIASFRNIVTSQITYAATTGRGYAVDLEALESAVLIDSFLGSGTKDGYVFGTSGDGSTFRVSARPLDYGSTGTRSFFSDETGIIRYTTRDRPATVNDTPLGAGPPPRTFVPLR